MNKKRVLVALSGGVDSAAAALLLRDSGMEVIAATLRLENETAAAAAEEVASALKIPHRVIPAETEFMERVLRPSALEYACGRTPNPCCFCNPLVKFALLMKAAETAGCGYLATGHYAVIDENGAVFRGTDRRKDQSYFLYRLPETFRRRLLFPLGKLTKPEVRQIAEEAALPVAGKPESQDTCFGVAGEKCGETLFRKCRMTAEPGFFRYNGKIAGRHQGIHLYTIGQRGGTGVALGVPAYIRAINPRNREIELVTEPELLETAEFGISQTVWHEAPEKVESRSVTVQIRYRNRGTAGKVKITAPDKARVTLETAARAVTPGQSAVFYDGDRLLGGGVIDG